MVLSKGVLPPGTRARHAPGRGGRTLLQWLRCRSSSQENSEEVFDTRDAAHLDVGVNLGGVGARHDHAAESEGGRLARAGVGLRHAADFAEESDLAEDDSVMLDRDAFLR